MLVQATRRRQEGFTRLRGEGRDVCKVALFQLVSRSRGAEEESALATGLDQGRDLAAANPLGELLVALDRRLGAEEDVLAAGRCAFDHEQRQHFGIDFRRPRGVGLALAVEVDALEVP